MPKNLSADFLTYSEGTKRVMGEERVLSGRITGIGYSYSSFYLKTRKKKGFIKFKIPFAI